jgi:predicted O-linked N-acetylglucosamine transferase (SPINDLY family)
LSLNAYYNYASEDAVSARLHRYFDHWHPVAHLSDAALAEKVGNDEIDILIDLSGHTGGNRLLMFARKPAPVQASWIGYPGTTGLEAVDYYLADRYFLPPGRFDSQFTEKLVYLPAVAPFLPDMKAPPVNGLPALRNGYVTFGSFNRLTKLRPSVIALWSRLLKALPDARMLLGAMPSDASSNPLPGWFAREGIARERLSFHPRSDIASYLALHHQVDMCLDTFPYTGGTTTNYALWMGVPTLTLAGETPFGRQGAANLGHVGLDGFVAEDAADFEAKGLYWAGNLTALAEVRAGLRARWEQSPARRPEVIAAGVESALRTMWQRWCAGLPAQTFDVASQASDGTSIQGTTSRATLRPTRR